MLPLADNNPLRYIRDPFVTWAIIFACVMVLLYQANLDQRTAAVFVHAYGAIPTVVFGNARLPAEIAELPGWATLISSMFLHGGLMHLVGNMLFLWVLGDNVEDAMGHARYVAFYLACGVVAALAHGLTDTTSEIPMIGASGAISGVIGAYLVLHPKASIKTLVWIFIIELPAWVVLGIWAAFQVVSALMTTGGVGGGVAWWAHIGGLVAGLVLVAPMRRRQVPLFDKGIEMPVRRGPKITMRPGPWKRRM
ncbi:MAG: rhomboid family intramembrane serine protease [Rhodospirillaceae bacterium]|nr:rhomboid family intramembrane serine protease [Rhodospirillaceae bacterium]